MKCFLHAKIQQKYIIYLYFKDIGIRFKFQYKNLVLKSNEDVYIIDKFYYVLSRFSS